MTALFDPSKMDGYVQTGLGIAVSVGLFVLGYRQTVGARKERARIANDDLVKTIMRRLILEQYQPVLSDIERLIEGKASMVQLNISDMLDSKQLLSRLFVSVTENDLISDSQRTDALSRLRSALSELETKRAEKDFGSTSTVDDLMRVAGSPTVLLALLTSIVGAVVTFSPEVVREGTVAGFTRVWPQLLGVFGASLAVVLAYYVYRQVIDNGAPKRSDSDEDTLTLQQLLQLIGEVRQVVKSAGYPVQENPFEGVDCLVEVEGKNVVVDARGWNNRASRSALRHATENILELARKENKTIGEVIFVTREKVVVSGPVSTSVPVRVVALSALDNVLRSLRKSA